MAFSRHKTRRKRVLIVCPAKPGSRSGNRVRALRYRAIFNELNYDASIVCQLSDGYDMAIVLHAFRSAAEVARSKRDFPNRPIVLVVTGTDLYQHADSAGCQESFELADRIVVAQPTMIQDLPARHQPKAKSIFQSAKPLAVHRPANPRQLRVVVLGHLRSVKDPFRTAMAVRQLPASSKIVVHHYGAALQESMKDRARAEMARNDRYRWLGEIPRSAVRRKLATAWLMVLSSRMEGGANVLSEAVAAGTPVLATNIAGSTGLLGADYQGFFEVGDTRELRRLMIACESEEGFYDRLQKQIRKRSRLVAPAREREAWKRLLSQL